MQQIQVTTTITVKEDGEIRAETTQTSGTSNNQNNESNAGAAADNDITNMTEGEAERYAVASDLANVCDYLDDSEVIKIRLIIQKAEARKEREEGT